MNGNNIIIKKRTDLRGADTQAQIFLYCYFKRKPLTCYQIAKGIKKTRQLVAYHLKKLVAGGELIKKDNKYMVNPVFLDEECWNEYYILMLEFINKIKDKVIYPNGYKKEEIIKNIIQIFPILFILEVEEFA